MLCGPPRTLKTDKTQLQLEEKDSDLALFGGPTRPSSALAMGAEDERSRAAKDLAQEVRRKGPSVIPSAWHTRASQPEEISAWPMLKGPDPECGLKEVGPSWTILEEIGCVTPQGTLLKYA